MQPYDTHSMLIQMFHVYKRYGAKNALVDINLEVADSEFLFISGPSGAGKSTLLRLLYMGEAATRGQIIIDGQNLSRIPRRRIPFLRRKFGIIFQDYKLIPTRTAYENIALVAEAVGTRRSLVKKKVSSLLRTVGMADRARALPPSLSGGEQQRIAVARAMAGNPKIIIADEPTGSLDAESAAEIMGLLRHYHRLGATVIVATHDTELIRSMGGRVVLLKGGHLEISTVIPRLSS
ncbi:cell division ATP-binding protein FtsE [Desulfonema ishimotonii]|uniref:Cell division ATP-binding protein FtsE n=1 Tax=Desulfonema ishimotonii TaxID=45657 RepID=A0A401G1X1_9BACT|nr:ATP-binding cassette domain-containing protein [Desulfonema ishimotonii]GBC63196.1 cell division ATP-binding protein FtsE [Desulfonema ishimotonii]